MGIYKELQKHCGSSVQNYIAAARTVQGYEDWKTSDLNERLEVIHRWQEIQPEIAAEKERNTFHSPRSLLKHGHKLSFDNGKKKLDKWKISSKSNKDRYDEASPIIHRNTSVGSTITTSSVETESALTLRDSSDDRAFEEAMKASGDFPLRSESEPKALNQGP